MWGKKNITRTQANIKWCARNIWKCVLEITMSADFPVGPGGTLGIFQENSNSRAHAHYMHSYIILHVHMLRIFQENSNSRARARCMHACMCTSHFSVIIKTSHACQQANPCKALHALRCMGWSSIFFRTFFTALFRVRARGVFFPHVNDKKPEQNPPRPGNSAALLHTNCNSSYLIEKQGTGRFSNIQHPYVFEKPLFNFLS